MTKLPVKKDYFHFKEEFAKELEEKHPDVCFFGYGSSNTQECNYGRSDIDGGIIIDFPVLTDKEKLSDIAAILSKHLSPTLLTTQFNLIDTTTARDGRFLSYGPSYTDFLKNNARSYLTQNYIHTLRGIDYKCEELHSAAFNFCGPGSVRNAVLYHEHDFKKDKKAFERVVVKSMEKTAKFPKKLIFLQTKELMLSRKDAITTLENLLLSDRFSAILTHFDWLLKKPTSLYKIAREKETATKILIDALQAMEYMVDSYLRKFPEHSNIEYKK